MSFESGLKDAVLLALVPWLGAAVALVALIAGMGALLGSMKWKTEVQP